MDIMDADPSVVGQNAGFDTHPPYQVHTVTTHPNQPASPPPVVSSPLAEAATCCESGTPS